MREVDRLTTERYAVPSLLLMESAAAAAARALAARLGRAAAGLRVLVLCGRGNNGGDGAALARILGLQGASVEVVLFGTVGATKGDARTNFEAVRKLAQDGHGDEPHSQADQAETHDRQLFSNSGGRLNVTECDTQADWDRFISAPPSGPDVIVDALFGTGLTRPLAGLHAEAVAHVNRWRSVARAHEHERLVVSLDVPSGLNSDASEPIGPAVEADLTITFTAPKPANVLPPAAHFNGTLVVADIGSPFTLIEECPAELFLLEDADARRWLARTRYAPGSYKNTHGHALVVAGSRHMTGAPVLTADAALRAGAGLVTVATPASAHAAVAARLMPEVMTAALAETEAGALSADALSEVQKLCARATVVAVGPGLTASDERTRRLVRALVAERTTPVLLDADALNALAPWPAELRGTTEHPLVLTPHLGEMRRLLGAADGAPLADRVAAAREFAQTHNLVLVLKGARTLVAAPDGRVAVNPTGNAGLGTAGAGDTLTGIITGCLAQAYGTLRAEADAFETVAAAVYIAGLAGDLAAGARGMRTMVASDVRAHLSAAVRALDPRGEEPR
jgi:NAD(P)H-hydrate epimerase